MGIVIEMTRKQVFSGEIEPPAFVRTATHAETLAYLAIDDLVKIRDAVRDELRRRSAPDE